MKSFTVPTINQHVVKAEYAVRGAIVIKGNEIEAKLKKGEKYPFDSVVFCNIGNPQVLKQKPITFLRQVIAAVNYPSLLEMKIFPEDVISRAKLYLHNIPGGVGAYSHSKGVEIVRNEVADFLAARDGVRANPEDIFLTDGASSGVKSILNMLIASPSDGIMVPIPQYPLYSASIELFGGAQISYYLTEEECWGLRIDELQKAYDGAIASGIKPRALVVINPGNPTGQCLSHDNMVEILKFCVKNHVVLMADEVYQENIWQTEKPFISFRKVALEGEYGKDVELVSYHSTSKGFFGECGRRGGYMELFNIDKDVKEQIYKMASISLCSNLEGQLTTGIMVNPPKVGEPSYEMYISEKNNILQSLKRRAKKLEIAFNSLPGVQCQNVEGALYAFPRIILPEGAIIYAKERGLKPDTCYCFDLLDEAGLVVVAGSGFGQRDNTFHFRCTILPPEEDMDKVIERFTSFHKRYMEKFQNYKGKEKRD